MMKFNYTTVLLVVLLCGLGIEAVEVVPAGAGRGRWRTFDRHDGLSPGIIRSIVQDNYGQCGSC